jgi:hypothetical protein
VNVSDKYNTGLKFFGDEGWIWVTREGTGATSSDPQAKGANLPPLDASEPKILDPSGVTRPLRSVRRITRTGSRPCILASARWRRQTSLIAAIPPAS